MNINFPNSTASGARVDSQIVGTPGRSKGAEAAGSGASEAAAGHSEVSLSDTNVAALKAQLGNLPSVRQDRVAALKQAVHNGTYQIDSRQLADAIQSDLFGPGNSGS